MGASYFGRIWLHIVSLAVVIFVACNTQCAATESKLVIHAKALLVIIGSSFEGCYLTLQEADLLDRTSHIAEAREKLGELSQCIENAPNQTKRAVNDLRVALSQKPKALAAFKDYDADLSVTIGKTRIASNHHQGGKRFFCDFGRQSRESDRGN